MKIAIMQPYFFPYLGYFDLINNVDLFLVYDTAQYIRRGWIHRNRVLHQNRIDWQYIIVPTEKTQQKTPIFDIQILQNNEWQERLISQLVHYKKSAPYAQQVLKLVFEGLSLSKAETSLSRLNVSFLSRFANLMGINFQYRYCSEINIEQNNQWNAEEKILEICKYFKAEEYINLSGGVSLYHPEAFELHNIKLTFRQLPTFIYSTSGYAFEPNLSIIDALMWNTPETVKNYLDEYRGN